MHLILSECIIERNLLRRTIVYRVNHFKCTYCGILMVNKWLKKGITDSAGMRCMVLLVVQKGGVSWE